MPREDLVDVLMETDRGWLAICRCGHVCAPALFEFTANGRLLDHQLLDEHTPTPWPASGTAPAG